MTYSYTYDGNGNILSVSDGTNTTSYVYDTANQLLRENNQAAGKTWGYVYDDAGNILRRLEYAYTTGDLGDPTDTVVYTYGDPEWGDLLTAYDGQTITHDAIGNPLTNGTWTYTWEHGRELASMTDGGTTWDYTYNADGLRTKRTNGTTTYNYLYLNGQLVKETIGDTAMYFAYDADGKPMSVLYNDVTYYYVTNLQGDVVAILSNTGELVVSYTYDAWGNPLTTSGTMADTLGTHNPLRYRGYVYDAETGLYYLQSRYYDPGMGRFINADGYASTGQDLVGNNMFAYCLNNPVNQFDLAGEMAVATAILIGSAVVGIVCTAYTAYKEYQAGFDTVQIIGDSVCAGFAGFSIAYTGGMSLYQCYQNYCYLNAITPVTNIGTQTNVNGQLQICANTANSKVSGLGAVVGTKKHTAFAAEVNALGNKHLATEISYKNGQIVPYGTKGSIRFDVIQYNKDNVPIAAWDFKTGSAALTATRIKQMQAKSGLNIPIYTVK